MKKYSKYLATVLTFGFLLSSQFGFSQFSYQGVDYIRFSLLQIRQGSTGKAFHYSWEKDMITGLIGEPITIRHDEVFDEGDPTTRYDKYDYGDLWLWFDDDNLKGFNLFGRSAILVEGHFVMQLGDNPGKLAKSFPNIFKNKRGPGKYPLFALLRNEKENSYSYGKDLKGWGQYYFIGVGDAGYDNDEGIFLVWDKNNKIVELKYM